MENSLNSCQGTISWYLLGYSFLLFMVLPWCCRKGLFNDSIIHSWYIFSVVLLPLPPPLNASCCRVAFLFSLFVLSEAVFWLIVRRATASRGIWDYSAVPCLNAQCHALASPTETLGAWHHLPWQYLLDVLIPIFAEIWLLRFPTVRVHRGHQPLRCVWVERVPQ